MATQAGSMAFGGFVTKTGKSQLGDAILQDFQLAKTPERKRKLSRELLTDTSMDGNNQATLCLLFIICSLAFNIYLVLCGLFKYCGVA